MLFSLSRRVVSSRRVFPPLAVWSAGFFLELDAMARPATECRNEVKSRLRDDAFVALVPTCQVMRARMVGYGLPDCERGFVYREEGR